VIDRWMLGERIGMSTSSSCELSTKAAQIRVSTFGKGVRERRVWCGNSTPRPSTPTGRKTNCPVAYVIATAKRMLVNGSIQGIGDDPIHIGFHQPD
jgi:hypothetical protein